MSPDEVTKAIEETGGDAACLHCQVSVIINRHIETRPEGPAHAMQLALALAEIIGDLLLPAPADKKALCVARVVATIDACLKHKAEIAATDFAAATSTKLH